jgi:DNA ligase (NAD+)
MNFDYIPTTCPSCGSSLIWRGVDIVCTNDPFKCPDRTMQILEHYLTTLGAENITATTLKKLNVNSIKSLYELDEFEISSLDGFGTKRAEQIIFEISKTLKTTPDKLLASFGITGIGLETSRSILKKYDFEEIWDLSSDELISVDGDTG